MTACIRLDLHHGSGFKNSRAAVDRLVTGLSLIWLFCAVAGSAPRQLPAAEAIAALPLARTDPGVPPTDWLLDHAPYTAVVGRTADGTSLVLENGLVRRIVRLEPNAATVAIDDLRTSASLLRGVRPEAEFTCDGRPIRVGGLVGQGDQAYLTADWLRALQADPDALRYTGFEITTPEKPFDWKRVRPAEDHAWPPAGVALLLHFEGPGGLDVQVRHELYDHLPVLAKSLTISNRGSQPLEIDALTVELLAAVEGESAVDARASGAWRLPPIDVLSDYMFHGMDAGTANRVAHWEPDPSYTTQVHYELQTPCLLVCRPPLGPGRRLEPGESLASFKVFLVVQDSTDRERQGLTLRRVWRTLAPWTTENPLMMHVLAANSQEFRAAVDQCADVGFEMIIHSFGSSLNMERLDREYLAQIRSDADYAHARGVQLGGYSLFSSRSIDAQNDVISPETGRPGGAVFGQAPCFCSAWGIDYERKLKQFLESTGLDLLEHDGPYPGDVCASQTHPGHRGLGDSQWNQWEASRRLYAWCRERGIYVNQPDCYFLVGANKTGMGYRETNWSLAREQQLLHARQHIFDGTWTKTPSMGWMFVPLVQYHGGGAAATIEPLRDNLPTYEAHLALNLGAGVQACWRGPRLYDSDATRALVARWVAWFKKYRAILESDIIHGRRPDGRDLDYLVHVNPTLREKALVAIYNPLAQTVTRDLQLPLYYTGLEHSAHIRQEERLAHRYALDRAGRALVEVTVPAGAMTWLVVEE